MKIGYNIKRVIAGLLIVIGTIWLTNGIWQPRYDGWRCGRIAAELSKQYGLVVRYGDPADFYVPPLPAQEYKGYFIGRTNLHSAHMAIEGVQRALAKYPHTLIRKFLKAVFIAGTIKIYNVEAGGTYLNSWIYISATSDCDPLGPHLYEKILHHELSSLLLVGAEFPIEKWESANPQNFHYLSSAAEIVKAAEGKSRQNIQKAPLMYERGFIHDYGMSSLNNDFNMYAELAMTDLVRLKALAQQYPRIKAKTKILVRFYSSLAPELEVYFTSAGLIGDGAGN